MKVKWSDGEKFDLNPGQVWISPENGEDDVVIDELKGGKVYWHSPRHNPHENPKAMWNFINGTDGFLDFLESCRYRLKE